MSVLNEKHVKYTCINCNFFKKRPLKKILKLNNSENLRYSVNLKKSEIWKILKIWPFLKEFWGLPCREIEQDLSLKIQKVWPEARRNKNKNNNTPTHPMTMPLKRLVKTKTSVSQRHTWAKDDLNVDGLCKKLCDDLFWFT